MLTMYSSLLVFSIIITAIIHLSLSPFLTYSFGPSSVSSSSLRSSCSSSSTYHCVCVRIACTYLPFCWYLYCLSLVQDLLFLISFSLSVKTSLSVCVSLSMHTHTRIFWSSFSSTHPSYIWLVYPLGVFVFRMLPFALLLLSHFLCSVLMCLGVSMSYVVRSRSASCVVWLSFHSYVSHPSHHLSEETCCYTWSHCNACIDYHIHTHSCCVTSFSFCLLLCLLLHVCVCVGSREHLSVCVSVFVVYVPACTGHTRLRCTTP